MVIEIGFRGILIAIVLGLLSSTSASPLSNTGNVAVRHEKEFRRFTPPWWEHWDDMTVKPPATTAPPPTTTVAVPTVYPHRDPCPEGWYPTDDRCYLWSGDDSKENWFRAELNCRQEDSHLVSLATEEESQLVRGLTFCSNKHWLGLVNAEFENNKIMQNDGWVWWDGTNHSYSRFQPVDKIGHYCGYVQESGNWTNALCSNTSMPWVCEKATRKQNGLLPKPKNTCPEGWKLRGDDCLFFSNTTANYFSAQLSCLQKGSHLVTIDSKFHQAFVQANMGCHLPFWIGLTWANPCLRNTTIEHCWEWSDLTPLEFSHWRNNEEPKNPEVECVHSNGYWSDTIGCHNKLPFVCEKKA